MRVSLNRSNHIQPTIDDKIETQQRNEICDVAQWKAFCNAKKDIPVILCVTPGASSELVYDAFLQEGITPQSIFCPDQFHTLYGKKLNVMPETKEFIWCLVGARIDARINMMYEEIVRKDHSRNSNMYLLSQLGCILPDTGLRHMICQCGKIVLMGENRMCKLLEKYCLNLGKIEVIYVADQEPMEANNDWGMDSIWFYVDIPSKDMPKRYREAYENCKRNGIYLSRYFVDHFMWYRNEKIDSYFTQKELISIRYLEQMQSMAAESSMDSHSQDKKRKHILFLASELSYIWYGVIPLFKYYIRREDTICTVVFPYIWNILEVGERNLKEMAENISEICKQGGIVRFNNNWCPDKTYEVCYVNLGISQWYYSGIGNDIRKASKMVISLQSIAYHTHYYAGNQEFEGMFAEHHREQIDYAVVSCFMAEWAAQKDKKWSGKLLSLGYPRMDALYEDLHNSKIPEQWKAIAEEKKVIYFNGELDSRLFTYCYDYCKKDKAVIIWRPHPYDFDTPHVRERIEKLKNEKNFIIDTNQFYDTAFNISDALVTPFCSSILVNYLFTNKPILILDNMKDSKIDFRQEAWYKASYVASDEETGRKFIDMIMENRDDKKDEKLPYRKFMQQGFDGKVCERIAAFVDVGFQNGK